MKKKRKRITEITVSTDEFLVIRRPRNRAFAWCEQCAGRTPVASPEDAARVAGVSARTVYRWIEGGKVHFIETHAGLLICLDSLAVSVSK